MNTKVKRPFHHGIVLGKFIPPHHGHRLVINEARRQSEHVTLLVSVLPDDRIVFEQRRAWLRLRYPHVAIKIMRVTWPLADAQAWADGALAALGGQRPDAVFSSETYGQQLADLWGCQHIMVDRERQRVPISATNIWDNPKKYAHYLDPEILLYLLHLEKK